MRMCALKNGCANVHMYAMNDRPAKLSAPQCAHMNAHAQVCSQMQENKLLLQATDPERNGNTQVQAMRRPKPSSRCHGCGMKNGLPDARHAVVMKGVLGLDTETGRRSTLFMDSGRPSLPDGL